MMFISNGVTQGIPDEDIGCHIPHIPEAIFGDFNWFLSSVRFGRLVSKAQSALFSVSATMKLNDEYQQDLETIRDELEIWRQSIPISFRPGERFARAHFASSTSVMAALRTHLVYHNFVMVLCRLTLQVVEPISGGSLLNIRHDFMNSARRVIELTGHIEVEPYAPSLCVPTFTLFNCTVFSDVKQAPYGNSIVCVSQPLSSGHRQPKAFRDERQFDVLGRCCGLLSSP